MENDKYLTEQIITYLGNKRSLIDFIDKSVRDVKAELGKEKIDVFDVFSGSGIVARYFKQHAKVLYVNDLEDYSTTINKCYLTNKSEINEVDLNYWYEYLNDNLSDDKLIETGFIRKLYSPEDDKNIKIGERVFYTTRNAKYIDTARMLIDDLPEPYKTLFLGNLLYEASVKTNTSGVFKGFYKNSHTKKGQYGGDGENALKRILADIHIQKPVLSNHNCDFFVLQGDSNLICERVPEVDLAYLDPPYNQHPYGSNYFMLNLINNYIEPKIISSVSGIPVDWNKSLYNKKNEALTTLHELCLKINSKYILISFNSEGFIGYKEMVSMLKTLGDVKTYKKKYNVYRGCRNLKNRSLYVYEYLFLVRRGV